MKNSAPSRCTLCTTPCCWRRGAGGGRRQRRPRRRGGTPRARGSRAAPPVRLGSSPCQRRRVCFLTARERGPILRRSGLCSAGRGRRGREESRGRCETVTAMARRDSEFQGEEDLPDTGCGGPALAEQRSDGRRVSTQTASDAHPLPSSPRPLVGLRNSAVNIKAVAT
jgi:hypothetical protein